MNPLAILDVGMRVLDRVLPDPAAKAAAQLEMMKLAQAGEFRELDAELQRAQMQADINKVEAGSDSLFKSGWRPAVGWVCVLALFANYIGLPVLAWVGAAQGWPPPPDLDLGDLLTLLLGLLGLGGLRTVEKLKGKA